MLHLRACVAALRTWADTDVDMTDFFAIGMPAIVDMLQASASGGGDWYLPDTRDRVFPALACQGGLSMVKCPLLPRSKA